MPVVGGCPHPHQLNLHASRHKIALWGPGSLKVRPDPRRPEDSHPPRFLVSISIGILDCTVVLEERDRNQLSLRRSSDAGPSLVFYDARRATTDELGAHAPAPSRSHIVWICTRFNSWMSLSPVWFSHRSSSSASPFPPPLQSSCLLR